jgi:predicted ATPase/class 3 adenylate cyclase
VFLFTDIEGSTRLWAEYPNEIGLALLRHDALMREAIDSAGGEVFKHTGDGVCAVFASTAGAVRAAVCAQRAVAATDWGSIGVLRVRMAVHAGEAESRDADWFGPALNRAARLMGIGHGGQVLLSASAYELASEGLGAGLSFADLGMHRLRDLTRAEHVWQLVADGLERSFPPLRSFDGFRGRLPSYLTSFVGRDDERELVGDELLSARLVTLVGPGGVGKSRLAAQVGADRIDRFSDGAWMFELAPLADGAGLEASMIATLGLSGAPSSIARDALFETLRPWHALLIIDNCEHLIEPVADLVHELLTVSSDLVVLATSREPLRVAGERVVTLGPLTDDGDAVQLFVDRATAIHHGFRADGSDGEIVARICRHLDGMPLAIELAAARTMAMTPAEIDRRLDQRFRLLSARTGDRGDRHGSLERVVEWSYDLLDDDRQVFFLRLCVFAGAFDVEAAHRVCWVEDEFAAIDMLEDLVAKSLLTATPRGDRTSYRMLETMRQYGVDRLPAAQHDILRDTHAEFFAELAELSWDGVRGADSQVWIDLLDDEFDNVRAAFHHALARQHVDWAIRITAGLFMYNHMRRLPEIFHWLEQSLSLPNADAHRLARHVRLHSAYAHTMGGLLEEAEREARSVLDASTDPQDSLGPLALVLLSAAVGNQGRLAEWERLASAARKRATELGATHDYDRAEAIWNLCAAALFGGSPDLALSREYLTLAKHLRNSRTLAGGLIQSGFADPDPDRGAAALAEARELTARTRDSYRYGLATALLGIVRSDTDPAAALRMIPELIEHARSTGLRLNILQTTRSYLGAFSSLGRYDTVAVLDGACLPISIRPAVAAEAVTAARHALGDTDYDELRARGAAMSAGELDDYLMTAVADVR